MEHIKPTVSRINAGKPGAAFFNFPIIRGNIETVEASTFIVNKNSFFSIIFNDGKSRWCYGNEKQRNADYLKLIGAPEIDTDIELDFDTEELDLDLFAVH